MTEFFSGSGYWALLLTFGVYQLGLFLKKKTGWALCNPILICAAVIIPFLLLAGIPNDTYQAGMESISWLLTPCTVCLGISLHTQLVKLKGHLGAALLGVAAGTLASLGVVLLLSWAFSLDSVMTVSLLPKSVTTAMAIPLSESVNGIPALTTAAVVITGNLGNIIGPGLCRLFRIRGEIAQGVAYGTAAHIIGTTKASEVSELTGAVSSLSLVVAGILTAIAFAIGL